MPKKMKKGTFEAMLCRAILNSKRSGCSYKAILNYITGNYEGANNTSALKRALKKGLADEILTRDKKMYYRLSKQGKEKYGSEGGDGKKKDADGDLVEDLELERRERKRKGGLHLPPRPKLTPARDTKARRWSKRGGFVDDDDVADLLVCTSFMNAYSSPLGISSFNVDMLRGALEHKHETALLTEIHMALLRLLIASLPEDSIEERRLSYLADVLNPVTWPEVLRRYVNFWLRYGEYERLQNKFEEFTQEALADAVTTMTDKTYFHLTEPEKLTLLSFLVDELLDTPTIVEHIQASKEKLRELRADKKEDDVEARREEADMRKRQRRREKGLDSSSSEDESSSSEEESSSEEDTENKVGDDAAEAGAPVDGDAAAAAAPPSAEAGAEGEEKKEAAAEESSSEESSTEEEESSSEEEESEEEDESEEDAEPPLYIEIEETIFNGDPNDRKAILAHRKSVEARKVAIKSTHLAWKKRQKVKAAQRRQKEMKAQRELMAEQQKEEERKMEVLKREQEWDLKEIKRHEAHGRAIAKPAAAVRAGGGALGMDRAFNEYWFFPEADTTRLYVLPGNPEDNGLGRGSSRVKSETHWGVYEFKEDIEALVKSLHSRGIRESALLKRLSDPVVYHTLTRRMRSREAEEIARQKAAAKKARAEKLIDREKLLAEKRAAEEARRQLLISQRTSSRRAAAHKAVSNMIGNRVFERPKAEKDEEEAAQGSSRKRDDTNFLSWANTTRSKYINSDPEYFSYGGSPPAEIPFQKASIENNAIGCMKEYMMTLVSCAESFDVVLPPVVESSSAPSEPEKSKAPAEDILVKHETEAQAGGPDAPVAQAGSGEVAPGETVPAADGVKHEAPTETTGPSSAPEDEWDRFRAHTQTIDSTEKAAKAIIRFEDCLFNHVKQTQSPFHRWKRQNKEGGEENSDGEMSIDGEAGDADDGGDGENSEFEWSDDEEYVVSAAAETTPWDTPGAREKWIQSVQDSKGRKNGSFYTAFFQLVEIVFGWVKSQQLEPKEHPTAVSPQGDTMKVPEGATPTNKIVWARIPGYPWWPGRECIPDLSAEPHHTKVLFFEDSSVCYVPNKFVKPWKDGDNADEYEELSEPVMVSDRVRFWNAVVFASNFSQRFPYAKQRVKRPLAKAKNGKAPKKAKLSKGPKPKDPNKKKAQTANQLAYFEALKDNYDKMKILYPDDNATERNRRAREYWHTMTQEEKQVYIDRAALTGAPLARERKHKENSAQQEAYYEVVRVNIERFKEMHPEKKGSEWKSMARAEWHKMPDAQKKPYIDAAIKKGFKHSAWYAKIQKRKASSKSTPKKTKKTKQAAKKAAKILSKASAPSAKQSNGNSALKAAPAVPTISDRQPLQTQKAVLPPPSLSSNDALLQTHKVVVPPPASAAAPSTNVAPQQNETPLPAADDIAQFAPPKAAFKYTGISP
jgi:hypothetical protein